MDEMRERIVAAAKRQRNRCTEFTRELISIASHSRQEEAIAMHVRREMLKLGYHDADVDRFGNVVGRIGDGRTRIIYDAHLDTPGIGDRSSWRFDPYSGDMKAGKIYGHGAANNKGGLAAIVCAGGIIRDLDLANDCTIYVIGSIQSEECEGLAYKALFDVEKLYPHFVVLSMPTGMRICRGQRGRAEIQVTMRGQPVHASMPEKGFNAIYGMSKIIDGVQKLNQSLPSDPFLGKATVAVTHIECDSTGANMLPESCRIIIDRRMLPNDQVKRVIMQIKELARGSRAKVEIAAYDKPSYRGLRLPMEKYFPTWVLPENHPLIDAAEGAYKSVFKKKPLIDRWTMSTAGVYTMGIAKVPTIGFGPSEESFSGPINDHVRIDDLEKCMSFYATLPGYLPDTEPIKIPRRRR
ncbi:MAG: YgeY family selenium metabolism-linked hydrolase [Deltaproteobacteria bacterium]|nr:YgeY family selenium metabolism-linked hydrolase [Deltaproteobacteria bacterium]